MTRIIHYALLVIMIFGFSANADVIDKAQEAVKDYVLRHNAEWDGGKMVVTIKGGDAFFEKFSSDDNVKIVIPDQFESTKITPNMILPITALVNNREAGKIMAVVRIEVYKDIAVASRKIGKGETIEEDILELKTRDIASLPSKYFISKDEAVGKMAKTMIQKGMVLLEWMLKEEPVVNKGSEIKIMVKSDNILIESQGTALMDGQIDDIISVRRADSRDVFQAKVVSPDTVEVQL